jgi:hypothetical protein
MAVRPVDALQRHSDIDDARVDLPDVVPAQLPFLHLADAEVVDDDVALLDQPDRHLPRLGVVHVERDVFLVGIAVGEIAAAVQAVADAVLERLALAQNVGPRDAFDLDDFGPALGEHAGRDGTGANPRKIADDDAFQCAFSLHGSFPPF